MAIHQSKHQSDLEKRLKILRQQFYGRNQSSAISYPLSEKAERADNYSISDVSYLRADLMKISILAGAALGIQIILYFLLKNNILNINLF